jgi:hypothetical protein
MKSFIFTLIALMTCRASAFVAPRPAATTTTPSIHVLPQSQRERPESATALAVADIDYSVVSLVVGQENYGLAIVCLGESIWSFAQAPTVGNAARVFVPTTLAAIVLVAISGPMVTSASSDPSQIGTGLGIATAVSIALAGSYVLRLLAPYSPAPKEIAAFGLLVAVAGFFSFSQNLIVDGFVTLPSLPTIDLPSLPQVNLGF